MDSAFLLPSALSPRKYRNAEIRPCYLLSIGLGQLVRTITEGELHRCRVEDVRKSTRNNDLKSSLQKPKLPPCAPTRPIKIVRTSTDLKSPSETLDQARASISPGDTPRSFIASQSPIRSNVASRPSSISSRSPLNIPTPPSNHSSFISGLEDWADEESEIEDPAPDLEGYLHRRCGLILREWRQHWVELRQNQLLLFNPPSEGGGCLSLTLTGASLSSDASGDREHPHCFTLVVSSQTYVLACMTAVEKATWTMHLRTGISWAETLPRPRTLSEQQRVELVSAARSVTTQQQHKSKRHRPHIAVNDFEILSVLGRGSYGKVMKVRPKNGQEFLALKVIKKSLLVQKNMVSKAKVEVDVLRNISHPFIVKLHAAFQSKDRLYFVMDYLPGGDLFFHLRNCKKFTVDRARFYAAEILLALEHLHNRDILYRDLKPENVMLDSDGHCCLTDFGMAKVILNSHSAAYSIVGTPDYAAPEMITGQGHSKPVDIWALGCLLFEMLVGRPPFYCGQSKNYMTMFNRILQSQVSFPGFLTSDMKSLISSLLIKDPNQRLVSHTIIQSHPVFKSIDFNKLRNKEYEPEWKPDRHAMDDGKYIDAMYRTQKAAVTPPSPGSLTPIDSYFNGFSYPNSPCDSPRSDSPSVDSIISSSTPSPSLINQPSVTGMSRVVRLLASR